MAAPTKKRATNVNDLNPKITSNDSDSESSDDESTGSTNNISGNEEIAVDFEGRNPIDSDFHGIKQLLHQLFLKAHISLSELTELIISHNYVGSVVKQAFDVEDEDSDEEDDDGDGNQVFGITTVVNLTEKQNLECITQLRNLLVELSGEHGNEQTVDFVKNLLQDDTKPVGLIINERFINIPALITVPLLRSLSDEMKKAVNKKMPYDFSYYIIICKLYKLDGRKQKKKKNKGKDACEILWSNPEEEFLCDDAEISFEFSVKNDTDSGLSGKWTESDVEMTPFRKVLIFKAEKLDGLIDKIETIVNKK